MIKQTNHGFSQIINNIEPNKSSPKVKKVNYIVIKELKKLLKQDKKSLWKYLQKADK